MKLNKDISIIIPVYNHELILGTSIRKILSLIDTIDHISFEIIAINDGSIDNSKKELEKIKDPRLIKIHKKNEGLGSVVQSGINNSNGKFIIILDMDLSYGLSNLKLLIQLSNSWDCIVLSKYLSLNYYPIHRKYLSYVFYIFYKLFFGIKTRDIGSGFIMIKSQLIKNTKFISNGFGIHFELFLVLGYKNIQMIEIPINYKHKPGSFRLFFHSFHSIKEIFQIIYHYYISGKIKGC